jgi:hypothetical protein
LTFWDVAKGLQVFLHEGKHLCFSHGCWILVSYFSSQEAILRFGFAERFSNQSIEFLVVHVLFFIRGSKAV